VADDGGLGNHRNTCPATPAQFSSMVCIQRGLCGWPCAQPTRVPRPVSALQKYWYVW